MLRHTAESTLCVCWNACFPVWYPWSKSCLCHTHIHTHTHNIFYACKHSWRANLGIVCRLAVAERVIPSGVAKHWPWCPIFIIGKSQKSHGSEYSGCSQSAVCFSAKNCCTAIAVWLAALMWLSVHLVSFLNVFLTIHHELTIH